MLVGLYINQDKSETTIELGCNILVYYHISLCMEASWEVDITASDTYTARFKLF